MTQAAFAQVAGVSRASINQAIKPGGRLFPAAVGKRVDATHPTAREYIGNNAKLHIQRQIDPREIIEPPPPPPTRSETKVSSGLYGPKAATRRPPPDMPSQTSVDFMQQIPDDIREVADKPLRALVAMFGTSPAFKDWATATKTLEDVHRLRLANAEKEGTLITRDLVSRAFVGPVAGLFSRLLNDGAKSIVKRILVLSESGATEAECVREVQDQMSSFIRPVKDQITKQLEGKK